MLSSILNAPLWVFIISLLAAILTWLAADQFRDQLLADSHRLVREVAMRYLQLMMVLFTLAVLGVFWAVTQFASQTIRGFGAPAQPAETATPEATATPDAFFSPATITPLPTEVPALPTVTLPAVETDASLSEVRTATVVGTGGAGVNMRDEPGLGGTVVAIIPESAKVTLQGEQREADGITWYLVLSPGGREGWVADLYLDLGE